MTIEIAGEAPAAKAVEGILRERLSSSGLDVSFATIEAVDPAAVIAIEHDDDDAELARIWIDLRSSRERITLYLVDGKRERVLVRHFARYENPEVAREELGHVVELALVALRGGERIGIGREAARAELVPEVAPVPVAPPAPPPAVDRPVVSAPLPAPRPATRLRAGLFYEVEAYAGGPELWGGPGLMVELRRTSPSSRFAYGALLSGAYRLPARADAASASTMRFEGGAVHVLAMGSLAVSKPAELAFGLGGGLDLLHAEARGDRSAELRFVEGSTRAQPTLRAVLRYEHAIPSLRLFAGLGLDVPLESARYVLAQPGATVVLFEAWSLRPFLMAGIETN